MLAALEPAIIEVLRKSKKSESEVYLEAFWIACEGMDRVVQNASPNEVKAGQAVQSEP